MEGFYEWVDGVCMNVVYHHFPVDPKKGHEMITRNEDESYTILIEDKLCSEQKAYSYLHAVIHIFDNDFDKHDMTADEIEARAHA